MRTFLGVLIGSAFALYGVILVTNYRDWREKGARMNVRARRRFFLNARKEESALVAMRRGLRMAGWGAIVVGLGVVVLVLVSR